MHLSFFAIPVVGALLGWLLNSMILRFLFYPIQPKKIFGFSFQGMIPKKKEAIAIQLSQYVSEELFSFQSLKEKFTDPANIEKIMPMVEENIDHFLRKKLGEQMPMISMFIGDKTIQQLKNIFMEELSILFPKLINDYAQKLESDLDIKKIIAQKITAINLEEAAIKTQQYLHKEIILFKLTGAATGILIGIIQIVISYFII